jgi:hypothetical protein
VDAGRATIGVTVQDAIYHQRFTQSLKQFSERLDELLMEMRRFEPSHVPAELLDEVASTLGELMLVLVENKNVHGAKGFTGRAASDARLLREGVRFGGLQSSQITEAIGALREELAAAIHEDKQAA